MGSKLHAREHHNRRWASALVRLTSVVLILSALLFWGSLSISRSSEKLAEHHSYDGGLLLPGFHLLEHQHGQQAGSGAEGSSLQAGSAAAAADPEELQQEQQQLVVQPLLSDVPGANGPPYVLPKLIHQTVKDKNSMSCEVQESIQSWIDMNPGYTHILYDDADLLDFVKEHYPALLPVYEGLPSNIERTDTWRYLVLHKLGGVYADSDVKCMQPISTWNQENGFDAAMIVGIAKRNMKTGDTREFNQFVIAAMPGHPVLATMGMVISSNLAYTFLKGLDKVVKGKKHDEQILFRTGPKAFTSALKAYANRIGASWPINSTQADQQHGVLFGSVRAMPKFVLGTGWDTLDHNMTCEEVKQKIRPEALICHQFFGTWKANPEKALQSRKFSYGDCNRKLQAEAAESVVDAAAEEAQDAAGEEAAAAGQAAKASTDSVAAGAGGVSDLAGSDAALVADAAAAGATAADTAASNSAAAAEGAAAGGSVVVTTAVAEDAAAAQDAAATASAVSEVVQYTAQPSVDSIAAPDRHHPVLVFRRDPHVYRRPMRRSLQ